MTRVPIIKPAVRQDVTMNCCDAMAEWATTRRWLEGVVTMPKPETVTVYSFCVLDTKAHEMRMSNAKATRRDIVVRFGGEVLEGTGQDVSPAEIDEHGRYRRIATGWGARV